MIEKIKRKIISHGFRKTFTFIAQRLHGLLFNSRKIFFLIDLCDLDVKDHRSIRNVEVFEKEIYSQISKDEINVLLNHGGEKVIELFQKRMDKGHRLFFLLCDGELAGASWVYTGGSSRFFVVPLTGKEFIILDVFSVDKFRGKGLAKINLERILALMAVEGFSRAYISTKEWNFYQSSIRKVGFVEVGRYRIIRVIGKSVVVWSSVQDRDFV